MRHYIKLTIYHYIFIPVILVAYTVCLIGNTHLLIGYYIHNIPIEIFKDNVDPGNLFFISTIYPSIAILTVIMCLYAMPIFMVDSYIYHRYQKHFWKEANRLMKREKE